MKKTILFFITAALLVCVVCAQLPLGFVGDIPSVTDFQVQLLLDQSGAYLAGDTIFLTFQMSKPANLVVMASSPSGKAFLAFPSKYQNQITFQGFPWSVSLGQMGVTPFEEAGTYTLQVLVSVSLQDYFKDLQERVRKAKGNYYFFEKPLTDELILSRMQTDRKSVV